jgi:hypothetical protein
MKNKTAESGPRMTLEITPQERAVAKTLKKEFKQILRELEDSVEVLFELRDAIVEQRPSKEDLKNTYRGRLLRYRRKIVEVFNVFLTHLKKALEMISGTKGTNRIGDPELLSLKNIVLTEVGELSDGVETVLDILDEVGREGFTKTLEQVCSQLEKRQKSIVDVIDNQLFNHIDNNILGKMKIGELRTNIRKRSRLIRQLLEK